MSSNYDQGYYGSYDPADSYFSSMWANLTETLQKSWDLEQGRPHTDEEAQDLAGGMFNPVDPFLNTLQLAEWSREHNQFKQRRDDYEEQHKELLSNRKRAEIELRKATYEQRAASAWSSAARGLANSSIRDGYLTDIRDASNEQRGNLDRQLDLQGRKIGKALRDMAEEWYEYDRSWDDERQENASLLNAQPKPGDEDYEGEYPDFGDDGLFGGGLDLNGPFSGAPAGSAEEGLAASRNASLGDSPAAKKERLRRGYRATKYMRNTAARRHQKAKRKIAKMRRKHPNAWAAKREKGFKKLKRLKKQRVMRAKDHAKAAKRLGKSPAKAPARRNRKHQAAMKAHRQAIKRRQASRKRQHQRKRRRQRRR